MNSHLPSGTSSQLPAHQTSGEAEEMFIRTRTSREELEGLHLWWQLPLKLPYSCGDTTFCLFVLDSTINVTDKGTACLQRSTRRLTLLATIRIMCSNLLKQVQCEEGISAEQMALMFPWPDLEAVW